MGDKGLNSMAEETMDNWGRDLEVRAELYYNNKCMHSLYFTFAASLYSLVSTTTSSSSCGYYLLCCIFLVNGNAQISDGPVYSTVSTI